MFFKKLLALVVFLLPLRADSSAPLIEVPTNTALYRQLPCDRIFVENRMRHSTCSATVWFDNKTVFTTNFFGGFICSHNFDTTTRSCNLNQVVAALEIDGLKTSESLALSPDKELLAVTQFRPIALRLFKVNKDTGEIDSTPTASFFKNEGGFHGVKFSNNGKFLATTRIWADNAVHIYEVVKSPTVALTPIFRLKTPDTTVYSPKSIAFTKDDNYIAIAYSSQATKKPSPQHTYISVHSFNATTGIIDEEPICTLQDHDAFINIEDIIFDQKDESIIFTNQGNDAVLCYTFDKATGKIGNKKFSLNGKQSKLSFPHGVGMSPDGKHLSVSNYGTDSFCIYDFDTLMSTT